MPFDAAFLIRAGSGIAFAGVGLYAALGGADRGRAAFGAICAAFGLGFVAFNVFEALGMQPLAFASEGLIFAPGAIAVVAFALRGPWSLDLAANRRARVLLGFGAAATVAQLLAALSVPSTWTLDGLVSLVGGSPFVSGLLVLAFLGADEAIRRRDARRTQALAAVSVGLAAFPAYIGALAMTPEGMVAYGPAFGPLMVVLSAIVIVRWLMVASAPGGRAAWLVAWGLPIAMLVGLLDRDPASGVVGVLRGVAALVISLGIAGGALDERLTERTFVSRSGLAAAALALLFITAQVAQNYLSASFGLLTGGIIAGAFLFAASPIQHAMERLGERHPAARGSATISSSDDITRREDIYLNAVRLALRDRRLTRAEERHLARLAEELGLGAARAHELLVQAESEAGVR